jgi:ElaB/YqjD/DUF883 family membrane-anchored ribosome-binding protein
VENPTNEAARATSDTIEKAGDAAREAIEQGKESAREYVSKGLDYASGVSDELTEFVQRQPWLALAGAFLIGYVAARALRRLSL